MVVTLQANFKSGNAQRIHNAAYVTRRLVKKYEFKRAEGGGRRPLEMIVQSTFPLMEAIFKECLKWVTHASSPSPPAPLFPLFPLTHTRTTSLNQVGV
jgi:hypothetical protein